MIKFFRKIRYNLMEQNKTGKYLEYAIGEIVLVVIGILIALSINNWNENNKKEVIEIQFLETLIADLKSDTIYFNRRIKDSKNEIDNYQLYVKRAYEEQNTTDDFKKLIGLVDYNSGSVVFKNSTYLELINAGQLGIFKNRELKNNIIALYKNYNIKEAHIREFNDFSSDYLKKTELTTFKYYEFLGGNLEKDIPNFYDKSEWSFINDRSSYKFRILEEIALLYMDKHNLFKNYFVEMKMNSTQLIIDINAELVRRNND